MSQTETTNGKRDTSSGDLKEIYMFIRDLFSYLSRVSIKAQSKNKDNYRIEWILALIRLGAIPYPDACVETAAGYRRLYDLQPEDFLHDWKTLHDYFGYPLSDIMQRMIPSGLPDGSLVPETLDLHAMPISIDDAQFRSMYTQMCKFPTKLIPEAMDLIAKAILERTLTPPDFAEDDFLSPMRWLQELYASMINGFWSQKRSFRTKYNGLLASLPTSRKMVVDLMNDARMVLEVMCIINKTPGGTHDREFIDAIRQNLLQSDAATVMSEAVMAKIKILDTRVDDLHSRAYDLRAETYLTQLRDCYPTQAVTQNHPPPHAALVAIVDPGKQKIISTRPIPKPSADINAQERMQPAQDIQTLDRRVNDFHSMLGQVSKDMKEVKETLAMLTSKENRQPNRGYGKSNKQQGPANQKPKHAAHKAKPGRAERKAPKAFNTSDDAETEEEAPHTEETIYRAYRATVMQPERRDESPLYVRKPFGISTRPSSAKHFDWRRQLIDGPPELISSDDEMPVAELVEAIMPTISGNGGASTVVTNLLENQLLRPDSHEEFVVSYGLPRPRIAVDYKKWSLLSHPEQDVLLNYVSGIDFLRDLPPTELKLVHKIEPDNSKLDYDLLSAIQRGVDEADMNRHVRLLRLLWNSRPKGHQHENEMILRAKILDNGMFQHRFPWIAPDIELADLEDPKFLPMDRETHTSIGSTASTSSIRTPICAAFSLRLWTRFGSVSIPSGSCSRSKTLRYSTTPSNVFRHTRRPS